jgi:peptidoglycan/xylan/chitin deacetylase (PgdA/CDA1 family)
VAITFDDGYSDNLHEALPKLYAADWPATVFVVAGQVGDDREFWWDELERVMLTRPVLPTQLRLTINGSEHVWDIGDATQSSCPSWNVLGNAPRTPRQTAYVELASLLRREEGAERARILAGLQNWANLRPDGRTSHRSLKTDELIALAGDKLVEVGAHTVSHPSLAHLPESSQHSEVLNSKLNLERILERPIRSFSYPFGGGGDYNNETIRLVKKAGFDVACANIPGSVRASTDRYQLPRMVVRDWDGDEFARRLKAAFAS